MKIYSETGNWQGRAGIVEHRSIIQNITEYHRIGWICNRDPPFLYEKRGKYDTSESPLPEAETWDCVFVGANPYGSAFF